MLQKADGKFIDFSEGKALMLNNADWLLNLNYVELLRDVGACFSVNNMLRAKCYEQRMEKGLSFLEFNYMIMQSYDFYYMFQHYGCNMQFGGDDQWSNMLGGTELIRRKLGKDAYAMTITLLTDSQGKKMGKTAGNAVWLDPNKTSPFEFYQYWRNVGDADVMKCIRMLTFLPLEQIDEMSTWKDQRLNEAKVNSGLRADQHGPWPRRGRKGPECCPRTVQRQRNGYRAHAFYSADRGRPDQWLHRHPDPDGQGWSGSMPTARHAVWSCRAVFWWMARR